MWEATFPTLLYCLQGPFGYVALSHLACIPMPLHSFILQLPSPSHCIWCQLDKFFFLFFSLHLEPLHDNVNCDLAVTATSPLVHTGHNPSSPPPTPVTAMSTPRYLINPVAATTATMPPLAPALTCVTGHTGHPAAVALTVRIFFSFHLKLVQDSVGCNAAAAVTSPCVRTGYPVAVISPFWGMPAAPLHLPLCASRVHVSHHRHSLYLVPPLKKKCKSFVTFTSNFPLTHTPHRLTKKNLAPLGHLDKFFFFFSSFSFSSGTGAGQRRSQHHCHLLPLHTRRPPLLAHHHITRGTQANLPPHSPVTPTTSATSILPPRHPLQARQPPR